MRVLITGGAGFIGSHIVDRHISNDSNDEVVVVDDLSGGKKTNVDPKATLCVADCRDAVEIDNIFKLFKPEIVYHLAANAAENKSVFSPIDVTSRNYDAFIKVLTPFIKYGGKRFIYTSSIAVYGAGQIPFSEDDTPMPEDLYGVTKLAAEETLKIMSKVHGFEYVIARPHNVYGPRQNMTDPYRNVVTIFMNSTLKKKPYYIYGDGNQVRCFSYIDDVVEALYKCSFANVSGMTFNIGSDVRYTVNQLAKTIGGEAIHLTERINEVKFAVSTHELAKKYLDYEDKTGLKEGIMNTWRWVKSVGYQEPIYDSLEIINDKVPKNWIK